MNKAVILGAGAWGTAIATTCARAGQYQTLLWGRNQDTLAVIADKHTHPKFPQHPLPENILCEPDIVKALEQVKIIFLAIPVQNMREFLQTAPPFANDAIAVNCSKGLEQAHLQLPHQILATHHSGICLTLAGPNFAAEIMQNLPAATVVAGRQEHRESIESVIAALNHSRFRPYYHFDPVGLEAAGMVKNIIAIAAGMAMAMQLGENARAALITRGIHEMTRLIKAFGGAQETIYGLGGIGDLLLTCASLQSRNTSFGHQLVQGNINPDEFLHSRTPLQTVEGAFSAKAVVDLFPKLDLPIVNAVHQAIYQQKSPKQLLAELFQRPLRAEA